MNRDFNTVDLTSSFYVDNNNYLINDTIIEINDSFTTSNSVRRRETNNTRKRTRRRPGPTSTSVNNNNDFVNDSVIEINNSDTQITHVKSPRKRRRDGRPANSPSPIKVEKNSADASEISPKKARISALECPICWDDMLNKPLASTQCGHVFCKKCIKKSLKTMKNCPKCRASLTGKNPFHSLYLS